MCVAVQESEVETSVEDTENDAPVVRSYNFGHCVTYEMQEFKQKFRCWSAKPSDRQREEVKRE